MSLSSLKIESLPRFSLNFAANIVAALWMLLGSIRAFTWVKPTIGQFVLFLVLALAANILFAWLAADFGSQFNEQGLISYLIWPVVMLIAGTILAKRSQNYSLLFVPVILWLTADTLLILLQSGIQFLGLQGWLPAWSYDIIPVLFMVLFVWQTAALLWVFAKKLHWPWWEQVIMLAGAIGLLVVWQKNVADQPIFKLADNTPTIDESSFYAQPALLNEQLLALDKNSEGVSDWYFVGVAGYASQDVFANEITEARQLFDVRFGTKGKSISLLNNPNTWQSHPIASKTSLEKTLKYIGKQMNADEDVLFLTLSSHGAVDENDRIVGDLVMQNPPLELEDIDPEWLRQTLDASGIRWRVIVVSACYSGGFIEKLASATTAIITASRADRASFGCTNDADLTYFGRAFFAQSLRENTSFERAFAQTVRRVGEREALMGFTPSEPQINVGSLMKTALPQLEKALFDNPSQDIRQSN
ncbi:MAG: C13 family peptidase [Moraxella sp.]|nr:C13 family peptidase [Moraxella sp.]